MLRATVSWLDEHGYRVIDLDASKWRDEQAMHVDLAQTLDFPTYYGHNLDALNDCLSDVALAECGLFREDAGLVVIRRIDVFMKREPRIGHHLLDALAGTARSAALCGHCILCLPQSGDPDLVIPPIGVSTVPWNDAEWLDSDRHPEA